MADMSVLLQSSVYGSAQSGSPDSDNNGVIGIGDIALLLQADNYGTSAKTPAFE